MPPKKTSYAGTARNMGMKAANGEYFSFLDADDYYENDALRTIYDVAKENDLEVLKAASYLLDQNTGERTMNAHYSHERFVQKNRIVSFSDAPNAILRIADVAWNGLYKASFILDNNIEFNGLRCVNDRSFFIQCILKTKRLMVVDHYLTNYRINLSGSLVGIRSKNFQCQIDSYNLIKKLIQDNGINDELKRLILKSELNQIFIWLEKFRDKGINTVPVEDILTSFFEHYDCNDVGNQYIKSFAYRHEFKRIYERKALEYVSSSIKAPKVTVIIPMYNSVRYLAECLESVINQSLKDIEIICVDDGSSDATLAMIQEYAQRDKRIITFTQNHGYAGRARNFALTKANGKYVTFVDGDDVIGKGFVQSLYFECEKRNADIVVSPIIHWNGIGNGIRTKSWIQEKRLTTKRPFSYTDDPDYVLDFTTGGPGGKIFRLDFIRKNQLEFLPISRSEDFYFVFGAIACAERISTVDEANYYYRKNNATSLESTKDDDPVLFWEANMELKAELQKLSYFDKIKRGYINNSINRFAVNLKAIKTFQSFEAICNKLFEVYSTELELDKHDQGYFYEGDFYKLLLSILEAGSAEEYLFVENKRLKERIRASNTIEISKYEKLKKELQSIRNSKSYRIGRGVTYLPRKLRGGILCYKQHGVKYTLNRIKSKIQKKFCIKKK